MAKFISATLVACKDNEGKLLMVQEGKDHIHGRWDFPGGGLEHDESVENCAKREVKEETGYRVEISGFYGVYIEESDTSDLPVIVYLLEGEIKSEGEPDNHFDGEILDYQFFDIEELKEMKLRKDNRTEMLDIVETEETISVEKIKDLRQI